MSQIELRIFESPETLYRAAADRVVSIARDAVAARERFLFVISGGGTPQPLYQRLAQPPYCDGVPWRQTHILWADERMVPPDDEGSNFGQAWLSFLRFVGIRADQIHRIKGELEPSRAADAYAKELQRLAGGTGWPRFDLVLLGLGGDGHTASLFPGQDHLVPLDAPTMAVRARYDDRPANRVSLTPAAINSARSVLFLVTGREKAQALAQVTGHDIGAEELPASLIRPEAGNLTWYVDRDAAFYLHERQFNQYHEQAHNRKGDLHDETE